MKEIIQLTNWRFKFRRSNKKGYYEIVQRRDKTFYCSCPSHKYNTEECKHIKMLKRFLNVNESGEKIHMGTTWELLQNDTQL